MSEKCEEQKSSWRSWQKWLELLFWLLRLLSRQRAKSQHRF